MRIITFVLTIAIVLTYFLFFSIPRMDTTIHKLSGPDDRNTAARNDFVHQRVNSSKYNMDQERYNTEQTVFSSSLRKEKDTWIPLTQTERNAYNEKEKLVCGKPFMHCCLGQGRQLKTVHEDISQLYVKWSKPLASLTTLLDYMSQNRIPCNLWFFGMSLSGDQTIGALCELMRDGGYKLDEVQCIPYENERWNEKDALKKCSMDKFGMPTGQYYQLTNPNRTSCPLAHDGPKTVPQKRSFLFVKQGGLMIINQGVHCNIPGCVSETLGNLLTEEFLSMAEENQWKVLYRETERQHFATPNGYHKVGVSMNKCCAIQEEESDFRNDEAREFLQNLTFKWTTKKKRIPIISLGRATIPLYFMHGFDIERQTYDCTHYVYSPWRFELTWDGILTGLKYYLQ
ncbi:hypothetical protein HJC23_011861 [Cyclotella cryptica]|uniref:Uncharacterized protein n=1 Tax=Cyclotella cryptica TaxID=29204 RepID=A0ABD3QEP4_9STRA|eukprot:CCRYP_006157-RA/>CCRYP_006157-RA protein AED:0.41 eAED:0.32 QI:0/-1/0/1/-1/1/1/0/398